jgi:Uncharacterised protein family (UPF0236).
VTEYMFRWIRQSLEVFFSLLDQAVVQGKTAQSWTVERCTDSRDIQFFFGAVTLNHSLMYDRLGKPHYPLDELLKLQKYKRYSPRVVYEVSKLASRMTCHQVAETLTTWTRVQMSHTSVMRCVREAGEALGSYYGQIVNGLCLLPKLLKVKIMHEHPQSVMHMSIERAKE